MSKSNSQLFDDLQADLNSLDMMYGPVPHKAPAEVLMLPYHGPKEPKVPTDDNIEAETITLAVELNDRFRRGDNVPGRVNLSTSVQALSEEVQLRLLNAVSVYSGFTAENDPDGARDFGRFSDPDAGDVTWVIDCYENEDCLVEAQFPENPDRSYRILSIMLD